jgi:hypothetical protein
MSDERTSRRADKLTGEIRREKGKVRDRLHTQITHTQKKKRKGREGVFLESRFAACVMVVWWWCPD